ncbi:uncharacterized protein CXorf65 homolog [Littorina saxatilis]|uniref:Uncharacterized protein n=1 Tax=Littorina saxatilis TaxID=31220 RepID=A0AAN9GE42_9CAEN
MFVTVRYGDDQRKIFNPHSKNENLLENIKLNCGCGEKEVVDVSDERGVVKNLRNFPSDYGSDFLKERETLVLLTVQNGVTATDDNISADNDRPVFTPHLTSLRNDREFLDTLNQDVDLDQSDSLSQSGRRHHMSEGDDDVFHKEKRKGKTGTPGKKSILRRSTKSALKK